MSFRLRAPLRLRRPAPRRVPCTQIEELTSVAKAFGMERGLADRPREHECWLRNRQAVEGEELLIVIHDRANGAYGIYAR